jgi:hypothetical protein
MAGIQEILKSMTPAQAMAEIAAKLKTIFPSVTDEDRYNFVVNLIGGAGDDKVSSMVHL